MPNKGSGDYHLTLLEEALVNENIKVIFPGKFRFFYFFPISRKIKKFKVKIFHIHWIHGFAGFVAKNYFFSIIKLLIFYLDIFFIKYILKTKIVWTINNLYSHEIYYPKLERFGRCFFADKADAIICHCLKAKKLIEKEFHVPAKKINVIPMGNYNKYYKNNISKQEARDTLNLNQNDFIFLHFGRIKEYKGVSSLIKSFIDLEKNDSIKLLIVGSLSNKQYGEYLMKLAEGNNNIEFILQYIPDDEIQLYMNASDIVVTPYRIILNSGEIILAMGFGKPIIAPKLGCIPDILEKKGSFIYSPHEKSGLKIALEEAINNKNKLKQMGTYNIQSAFNMNWEEVGKKTRKLYNKLLLTSE